MINEQKKREILDLLGQRINLSSLKCPMCGHSNFTIADGYVRNEILDDFTNVTIGGTGIPSIPIICTNCGFISYHALGVLGLLNRSNLKDLIEGGEKDGK
jgi:hypothetical protein